MGICSFDWKVDVMPFISVFQQSWEATIVVKKANMSGAHGESLRASSCPTPKFPADFFLNFIVAESRYVEVADAMTLIRVLYALAVTQNLL